MYNRGGQQRTTQLPCGMVFKGHPNEVNKKVDRHRKYCKYCLNLTTELDIKSLVEMPEFDKTAAKMNGWNGITAKLHIPKQMMTTACYDGKVEDYIVSANNIPEATRKVKEQIIAESNIEYDSDDEEHNDLVDEVIDLILTSPCRVKADDYSGCGLDAMSNAKLRILIKLTKKEIDDYNGEPLSQGQIDLVLSCIDCSVTKEMALDTIEIKYPSLFLIVKNNWNRYYKKYLDSKK
jgi:hypothetical protein